MYPAELEIKDTTDSTTSTSYLDLLLSIGRDGQLHTSIYDKRDDFNFHITNFPFLSSNIPSSPAYGVLSLNIRCARACSSYECFILRAMRLSSELLKQGYLEERLKSSFRKFYGRYGDLIQQYELSFPLTNAKWHSDPWPTVTSQPIRLSTNFMTLIPTLTFTELWVVFMEHLQRMWHASRERLLFRTPGSAPPPILGLACAPIVETRFLELAMSLLDFSPRIPLGSFSILLNIARNWAIFWARPEIKGTCLIFMAPGLWYNHRRTWRVCQTAGYERSKSRSTHFPSGSSRSLTFWNVEFDDFKSTLSTPDSSPFSVTMMLSENFPFPWECCRIRP